MNVPNQKTINHISIMAGDIAELSVTLHADILDRNVPAAARLHTIMMMAATIQLLVDEVEELERGEILNREATP